jgi:hypothetical protein
MRVRRPLRQLDRRGRICRRPNWLLLDMMLLTGLVFAVNEGAEKGAKAGVVILALAAFGAVIMWLVER